MGCAIIGQTAELAPADRRIYAIRDVTGTVESMPLITGSILSKKLAAGLSGLVMDVTYGSGAFMTDPAQARELATIIAQVATAAGCPTVAMLTDMNETLGRTAGHATEVLEAIAYLRGDGEREARLHEVTAGLAAQLLVIGRLAPDLPAAHAAVERVLADGSAAERFGRMVAALGGPSDLLEHPDRHVVPAPVVVPVPVSGEGFIAQVDTRALGLAIVGLGGGRSRPGESIDTGVGFSEVRPIGTPVRDGDPLLLVHARDRASGEAAARAVAAATVIGDAPPPRPVILDRIAG